MRRELLKQGATIGIFGDGQLARMLACAAYLLGYRVVVFGQQADGSAGQVVKEFVCAPFDDFDAVECFARRCDVITSESDHIPVATLEHARQFCHVRPLPSVIAVASNRFAEKKMAERLGIPVPLFAPLDKALGLVQFDKSTVVKLNTTGFDGRNQHRISNLAELQEFAQTVEDASCWTVEELITFDAEVSYAMARSIGNTCADYPVFQNVHDAGILRQTSWPATVSEQVQRTAATYTHLIAEELGVIGMLVVEFFVVGERVLFNELAARVHNSAHGTLSAAFVTSQFENHIRAITGLPLGSAQMLCGGKMTNLLGDELDGAEKLIKPGVTLVRYGKGAGDRRKRGHLVELDLGP